MLRVARLIPGGRKGGAVDDDGGFGVELRRRRVAAGLSLKAFAVKVAYSKSHISRVETGEKSASEEFARHCDRVLAAGGALVKLAARSALTCPYPGLTSFRAEDARWFFGREQVVAELVSLLADPGPSGLPVIVAGPSGPASRRSCGPG
ncbi:helix-turn-helix domain-containing protein [Nonomuraea polychroma]|uniref:helix-turn-helix domain-containing protein n=1 Tax=Nonomuraea polychroma TaxID=46176 RepID=UPI003D90D9CE